MVKSRVNGLENLLKKSLSDDYHENFKIIEEKSTILTAPGEHYGSIMLAIDVVVASDTNNKEQQEKKTLHLVAKLPPSNEILRTAFDIQVTFKKEVLAYTVAIPALVQLEKEYGVFDENKLYDKLFPKCYGARTSLDENKNVIDDDAVLIFENLKVQGYKTEDRLVGFDLSATNIIIKDLARFHAVPIALKLLKPKEFKEKIEPCLVKNKGLEQLPPDVGLAFHNAIMDGARNQPELEPYLERLQKCVDYAAENPYVHRPPPNEPWGTMNHADFWVSNTMLLKDSNGNALASKIVDLQLMRYYSPLTDLTFFLFTSVINSVLEQHYDHFLKLYHETFLEILKEFKVDTKPFEWNEFLKELELAAPTEVYHVLVMLKPICTERGKVENTCENFQDSDWSRKDLLGENHQRKLKDTVLAFVKRNWI